MLVAQISDFHVSLPDADVERRHQTTAHLERAVACLAGLDPRPEIVLCTGDLVQDGQAAEYQRVVAALERLPMPAYVIPGNHDDREALRAAFVGRGYLPAAGFLQYVVDAGPLRLVALDTLVPGAHGGRLCRERLDWLETQLASSPRRPTLVFMHHPPFATGIRRMDDAMALAGADELAAVIARHPQVERVLCGHLHRPIVASFAGTLASTCPSTGAQVALDLRPGGKVTMVHEPPGYLLHLWQGARGLVSHVGLVQ